ncbi:MAG: response regulator, partial [Candidatus Eremiobacteraeota bacterium]|nr:response regulator [Candidatus Eremiobacteraeota bacterium]
LQQLKRLGYGADVAENGRMAIDAVAERRFDLVLMDCEMPEVDGYTATRAIRASEATTGEHVPIVAMTANAMAGDREACLAAGMDDYLAKPVQLAELRDIVERYTGSVV